MILNLDKVEVIDELLILINQVRDEFRKKFSFFLILWIIDKLLVKLIRLVFDFKSWVVVIIKFEFVIFDLIYLLKMVIDSYWINELVNE